jgi:hypothetical protein
VPSHRWWVSVLALLVGAIIVAAVTGCSDDGGETTSPTSTSSLDPGVTFENDVTVPTTAVPGATTTTAAPGEVQTTPREVPDEFPQGFPVPDGAEVEVGSTGTAEGERRVAVDYAIEQADPAEVFAFYEAAADEGGWNVLLNDTDGQGQQFVGQLVFETDTYVGNVLVSGDGGRGVLLTLTATMPA